MEVVANPSGGQEASFVRQQRQTCTSTTGHGLNASCCCQPPAKALWSGERLLAVMLFGFFILLISDAGNHSHTLTWNGQTEKFFMMQMQAGGIFKYSGNLSFYQLADDYCLRYVPIWSLTFVKALFWECLDEIRSPQMTCKGHADVDAPPDASLDLANFQSCWHDEPVGEGSNYRKMQECGHGDPQSIAYSSGREPQLGTWLRRLDDFDSANTEISQASIVKGPALDSPRNHGYHWPDQTKIHSRPFDIEWHVWRERKKRWWLRWATTQNTQYGNLEATPQRHKLSLLGWYIYLAWTTR